MKTTDWVPPAIGLGVGLGEGFLAVGHVASGFKYTNVLYRMTVLGLGLFRELRAQPGESPISTDINYALMTAAVALEANQLPRIVGGAPVYAYTAHAHGATCSTCASRTPVSALPLLTPAASLRGY